MKKFTLLLASGLLANVAPARADVKLPAIFSEHAVLQRAASVPVWGKADPGEQVSVTLDGQTVQTNAAPDGKWKLALDLKESSAGPFEMTVTGKNKIVIPDVVVGQTWLLIGQSNPELLLKASTDAPAEIARSANPLLREFRIERKGNDTPQDNANGKWTLASPRDRRRLQRHRLLFRQEIAGRGAATHRHDQRHLGRHFHRGLDQRGGHRQRPRIARW